MLSKVLELYYTSVLSGLIISQKIINVLLLMNAGHTLKGKIYTLSSPPIWERNQHELRETETLFRPPRFQTLVLKIQNKA